jgi:hypothetical protein
MNTIEKQILDIKCALRDAAELNHQRETALNNLGMFARKMDTFCTDWQTVKQDTYYSQGESLFDTVLSMAEAEANGTLEG